MPGIRKRSRREGTTCDNPGLNTDLVWAVSVPREGTACDNRIPATRVSERRFPVFQEKKLTNFSSRPQPFRFFLEISWAKPTRWHDRWVMKPPGGSAQRLVGYGTGLRPLLIRQVSRTWVAKLLVRYRTVPAQLHLQPVRKDRPLLESTSLLYLMQPTQGNYNARVFIRIGLMSALHAKKAILDGMAFSVFPWTVLSGCVTALRTSLGREGCRDFDGFRQAAPPRFVCEQLFELAKLALLQKSSHRYSVDFFDYDL